jgi:leader peptidase (prepilin peptidase)/N-methyltransferase
MFESYRQVNASVPWFFPMFAGVLGACIGSFLNVVIYRVPAGRSIVRPGSQCACGTPIAWHDNLPILSWILLRGKARCCGRSFSARYPSVEALTAVLFAAAWLRFTPVVAVCVWVFLSCLVCATFIDLDQMIIPDVFTIGLALAGFVLSLLVPDLHGRHGDLFLLECVRSGADSVTGIVAGSGLVLWIALLAESVLKKEAMGFGDVKFVGAIGAFCGWHGALFSVFGGAAVGTVWIVVALALRKIGGISAPAPKAETPEGAPADLGFGVHVPFGPMLAIAAALYLLVFRPWVDAWFANFNGLF